MCFSAQASFGASLFLFGIGYVSFKNIKSKDLWPLAVIPLMFAIQQAFEGFVWLSQMGTIPKTFALAKYGFMFFAFAVWPFWMPFTCWRLEENTTRKKSLFYLLLIGFTVSITLLIQTMLGVNVIASCNHISYSLQTAYGWNETLFALGIYAVAVIAPLLISTYKNIWIFGLMTSLTLLLTMAFFWYFLISVWCFFAAIVSAFIYLLVRKK